MRDTISIASVSCLFSGTKVIELFGCSQIGVDRYYFPTTASLGALRRKTNKLCVFCARRQLSRRGEALAKNRLNINRANKEFLKFMFDNDVGGNGTDVRLGDRFDNKDLSSVCGSRERRGIVTDVAGRIRFGDKRYE